LKKTIIFIAIFFLLFITNSYSQNLVLDCQFDGNLTDNSVSNNHFSSYGTGNSYNYETKITGMIDSSIAFTGGKGMVSGSAVDNSQWGGTAISVWVKNGMDGQIFQGAYWGTSVSIDNSGKAKVFFDGSSSNALLGTTNLNDGNWHHILAQNNGDTTYLYIDGQLDAQQAETLFTLSAPNANAKIYLGLSLGNANQLNGNIDDLKLYNISLAQNDITTLANRGELASYSQNLVLDCQFDGNLIDSSASNNHFMPYGSGSNFNYEKGNVVIDSSIAFMGGKGMVSDSAVDNSQWGGTAISVWVKNGMDGQIFQGAYWGVSVSIDNSGKAKVFFDGSSSNALLGTTNLNDGSWHHILAQNNGDTTYLYIDGQLDAQQAETLFTLSAPNANAKIYLGLSLGNANQLNGNIDDLKVYDAALTPNDITILANGGTPLLNTSIVEIQKLKNIRIYPNPTTAQLTLENLNEDENQLSIFNANGQLVHTERLVSNSINVGHLNTGIYFVAIFNEKRQLVARQQLIKK
jgi:hypothetical protein